MELYLTVLSPVWWISVVLVTVLTGLLSSWVLGRVKPRGGGSSPDGLQKELRLRLWMATLLCVANIAMLVALLAGNWRAPALAGPIGLAFVILCLLTLTLAWHAHRAAERARHQGKASTREGEG